MSRRDPHPALHRALIAARAKREERGAAGDGTVVTPPLEADEALALDGLLSSRRPILPGRPLRVGLSRFEAALREYDIDPRAAYELVGAGPLRDRVAERAAAGRSRLDLESWLTTHPVLAARPPVAAWLDRAVAAGRVRAETRSLVAEALAVLGRLPPAAPIQRTVLSAAVLGGDPHGLDPDTPLHRLTVSLLAAAAGLDEATTPAREVWAAFGVVVDPISSNVAVLNLPPCDGGLVAEMLRVAGGSHAVLTHGQLAASRLGWPAGLEVFSCENPSVLVAAEARLGPASAPLICTGGRPSDAVRLLLGSLSAAGAEIRHHGDFDAAGVQILRDLEARCGASPWRFDLASLGSVLARLGRPRPSARARTLEAAVDELGGGIAEELLIDELTRDLAR
jgi:uncharacterized protein (TIGR02679 family)